MLGASLLQDRDRVSEATFHVMHSVHCSMDSQYPEYDDRVAHSIYVMSSFDNATSLCVCYLNSSHQTCVERWRSFPTLLRVLDRSVREVLVFVFSTFLILSLLSFGGAGHLGVVNSEVALPLP